MRKNYWLVLLLLICAAASAAKKPCGKRYKNAGFFGFTLASGAKLSFISMRLRPVDLPEIKFITYPYNRLGADPIVAQIRIIFNGSLVIKGLHLTQPKNPQPGQPKLKLVLPQIKSSEGKWEDCLLISPETRIEIERILFEIYEDAVDLEIKNHLTIGTELSFAGVAFPLLPVTQPVITRIPKIESAPLATASVLIGHQLRIPNIELWEAQGESGLFFHMPKVSLRVPERGGAAYIRFVEFDTRLAQQITQVLSLKYQQELPRDFLPPSNPVGNDTTVNVD